MGEWIGYIFLISSYKFQISNFISRRRHILLNESNYDMYPDMFSTMVIDDLTLYWTSIGDGIQHCATYNPPGPSTPGLGTPDSFNPVWFFRSMIFSTVWLIT